MLDQMIFIPFLFKGKKKKKEKKGNQIELYFTYSVCGRIRRIQRGVA